jgi:hypothetical protein
MRRHLLKRAKSCPDRNGLTLTEEIAETVLANHEYHRPKQPTQVINNNNNNIFNMVTNIVNSMEFDEKMRRVLDYRQEKTLDFEDGLEKKFAYRVEKLENDKFSSGYFLTLDDLFKIINDVTLLKDDGLEEFNVLYDKVIKRFRFYRCLEWESFLEDIGSKELISLIKSYYLDTYEKYLIRNLHVDRDTGLNRIKIKEHLEIYYRFISIFDLTPSITDCVDEEILGHRLVENNDTYLAETYVKLFQEEKNRVKSSDKLSVKRKIVNIVKENTTQNLQKLNKAIMEILRVDDIFRDTLLKSRQLSMSDKVFEFDSGKPSGTFPLTKA